MSSPHLRGKAPAFGGVVINSEGEVLLRKPSNGFDGYAWTFAKGRPKPGQSSEETALCEVLEETGWECEIVAPLGWFDGGTTSTQFFLMKPRRDTGRFDSETARVVWVPLEEARRRIAETKNPAGRSRDLAVLDAAADLVAKR